MKRTTIFFGMLVTATIMSCNSSDYKTGDTATANDSSMMIKDSANIMAATDSNAAQMSTTPADSASVMTTKAKPVTDKKGKKGKVSIIMPVSGKGDMVPDKEGFYANTEVLPAYPGGQKSLEKFFEDNIQYPQEASDAGVEGTVALNFAVDENGKVYAPKLTNEKIGYGLEQEALRVFNKMPKWTPGKIKGKNVKTRFTLPVKFQIVD